MHKGEAEFGKRETRLAQRQDQGGPGTNPTPFGDPVYILGGKPHPSRCPELELEARTPRSVPKPNSREICPDNSFETHMRSFHGRCFKEHERVGGCV